MDRTDILFAIEHRAYNDATREIERNGVTLTWEEIDQVGGEEATDWMCRRLGVVSTSDEDGIRFAPRRA